MDDDTRMVLNCNAMERCNEDVARLCRELAVALERDDQNVLQRFTAIEPCLLRIRATIATFSESIQRPRGGCVERLV